MDEVVKAYLEPPANGDESMVWIYNENTDEEDFVQDATNFLTSHCKLHLEESCPANGLGGDKVTSVVGTPVEVYIPPKKYQKRNVKEMMAIIKVAGKFGIRVSVMHSIGKSRWERFDLF